MYIPEPVKQALNSIYASDEKPYGMWSIKGRAVAACDLCVHVAVGSYEVVTTALGSTASVIASLGRIIVSHAVEYVPPRFLPERVSNLNKMFDETNKTTLKDASIKACSSTLSVLVIRVGMVVVNFIGLGFPDIGRSVRDKFVFYKGRGNTDSSCEPSNGGSKPPTPRQNVPVEPTNPKEAGEPEDDSDMILEGALKDWLSAEPEKIFPNKPAPQIKNESKNFPEQGRPYPAQLMGFAENTANKVLEGLTEKEEEVISNVCSRILGGDIQDFDLHAFVQDPRKTLLELAREDKKGA